MYRCIKNGTEIIIESESALEEMLSKKVLTGNERAINIENGMVGMLSQSRWFKNILERNPDLFKESLTHILIGILCILLGLIFSALFSFSSMSYAGDSSNTIAEFSGRMVGSFIVPTIIWALVRSTRKKNNKKKPGFFYFGTCYLIVSILALLSQISSHLKAM